jgi:hypothetical protein
MLRLLRLLVLFAALPALARHVVFVDNSAPPNGDGTAARPLASIAAADGAEVIFVVETATPYVENVTLRKGQSLIGSAYGLDALRVEMKVDLDASAPARQGVGPVIAGTVNVAGDNVVAGCTLVPLPNSTAIVSSGAQGQLAIRAVWFRTSQRAFAIFLQEHHGGVTIVGGGVEATAEGSGIGISGGEGDVTVERFPMRGAFGTALQIHDRSLGAIVFRNGSPIRVDDAVDDAIAIAGVSSRGGVTLADRVQIHGRRRGLVAERVVKLLLSGAGSSVATSGGAAVDLRDCGIDVVLESLSAEGETLVEGAVLDRVHGRFAVTGRDGKPGSGGAIRSAKGIGIRVAQTGNVRFANMTITARGTAVPPKGARCGGDFDVNSTAPCPAALYLRHLTDSTFENIIIEGGGATGINANNVRDLTFTRVEVRRAGDQSFESGVLLQEVGGTIRFTLCTFADNAGSGVTVEQRFNSGKVVFDRCTFSAAQRPLLAPHLFSAHALGGAALTLEVSSSEMRDNAGSAVDLQASGTSTLAAALRDVPMQRLGTGALSLHVREGARAALALHAVRVAAPAVVGAVVEVAAADASTACVDLDGNAFQGGGGTAVRLAASGAHAQLQLVGAALAESISARNGGASVVIDGTSAAVHSAVACR